MVHLRSNSFGVLFNGLLAELPAVFNQYHMYTSDYI